MTRLPALLLFILATPLTAQHSLRLSAGVTSGQKLVADAVVRAGVTTVKPDLAPGVALTGTTSIGKGYQFVLELQYATSALQVTDSTGTYSQGSLGQLGVLGLLQGKLTSSISWQAGGGALFYRPANKTGIFLDGSPRRWMIAAGLLYSHPIGRSMAFTVNARADSHEFTTPTLQSRDFQGAQGVVRVGLWAGVERRF